MELIVALLLTAGIGGGLSLPYLRYQKYVKKINQVAENNQLEVTEVSIDELHKICSTSFDTHHWAFLYNTSRATLLASGYEKTENVISCPKRVVVIESTFFIVPFTDFGMLCEWNDVWVKEGLLASWHKQYKESQK